MVSLCTIDGLLHATPTYFCNFAMVVNMALSEQAGFGVGPTGFAVFDKGRSEYAMEWATEFLLFPNSTEAEVMYAKGNSQFSARASAGIALEDVANYALTLSLIQERGTENPGSA